MKTMNGWFRKTTVLAAFACAALTIRAADVAEVVSADGQTVTGYATLQAAFDAVEDNETIRVIDDISLGYTSTATQWFTNSVTASLDLNGHTIDGCYAMVNGGFNIMAGKLIIEDASAGQTGAITASPTSGSYVSLFCLQGDGQLVLNSGKLSLGGSVSKSYGVYMYNTGTTGFTMNGGELSVVTDKAYVYGVNNPSGRRGVTITGGKISVETTSTASYSYAYGVLHSVSSASLNMSGGSISAVSPKYAYAVSGYSGGMTRVTGGDFYSKGATKSYALYTTAANCHVTGGRFASYKGTSAETPIYAGNVAGGKFGVSVTPASGCRISSLSPSEEMTIAGVTVPLSYEVTADPSAPDVAEVVGQSEKYKSVMDAIGAAGASGTVKLLADADTGKNPLAVAPDQDITLDLNGCTLYATNVATSLSMGAINVAGTFTLTDTSAGAAGAVKANYIGVKLSTGASFTLAAGTLDISGAAAVTRGYAIYGYTSARIRVTGGTIRSNAASQYVAAIGNGTYCSDITITGGDFFVRNTSSKSSKYVYIVDAGTGSVTGGRFTFECTTSTSLFGSGIAVEGGTFSFDPTKYVPVGNKMVTATGTEKVNPFGTELTLTYAVVVNPDAKAVAKNLRTETEYYSPQTAVDAAETGDTIQLLENVDLSSKTLAIAKGIALDLNGHSVTSSAAIANGTLQLSGGTVEHPVRLVDTGATKGVIAGISAVNIQSGAACYTILDGVTLFGSERCIFEQSGLAATRSTLLCSNVTASVVTESTQPGLSRDILETPYACYSDIELVDCDFTVSAVNAETKSSSKYYLTMFRVASPNPTLTIDGGTYRVTGSTSCYGNIVYYYSNAQKVRVKDGRFAITAASVSSLAFYGTGASANTNICLQGGYYGAYACPSNWVSVGYGVQPSDTDGYTWKVEALTAETAAASLTRGGETTYFVTLAQALASAKSGDTVEVCNPNAESVTLPAGVSIKTNGKFTGTVASGVGSQKVVLQDGVYTLVDYTAEEATASLTVGDVTTYYGTLDDAIKDGNGTGGRVKLLRDIEIQRSWKRDSSALDGFVYSALRSLTGCTIDGWDETLGRNHTVTFTGASECSVFAYIKNATIEHVTFVDLPRPLCVECESMMTMRYVDVYGEIEGDGNTGIYCVYCWDNCLLENCTNYAMLTGSGVEADYEAVFIGYTYPSSGSGVSTLSFTNCVNEGTLVSGKASLFLGNPCGDSSTDVAINCAGCVNNGAIMATFIDDDYNMNWYYSVDGNAPHIILNGTSITKTTTNFRNIADDSENGVVNYGYIQNGPYSDMELLSLPDGTFYVKPATGNLITNIVEGGYTPAASYRVSVGLYVSVSGGSSRDYATESFATNDAPYFVTTLKDLDFIDATYKSTHAGTAGTLAGNETYADESGTYYVVRSGTSTGGEVAPAEMCSVSAYDANGKLLATVAYGGSYAVARIVETDEGYLTLQEAIDAVGANETIKILRPNAENLTVTNTWPFTMDSQGHALTGSVTVPEGWGFEVSGDTCAYKSGVARNEEKMKIYETLAAAVADLETGATNTITMISNHVLACSIKSGTVDGTDRSFVLDLNGKTIDGAGQYGFWLTGDSVTIDDSSGANVGLICNCVMCASDGGGLVKFSGGILTVNGGVFSNNVASAGHGGAFFVSSGDFVLNGGVVVSNRAPNGAGVSVSGSHTFTMNGGAILNNVATTEGGGVALNGSETQMAFNGGCIAGNRSSHGGGIYLVGGAELAIGEGTVISNNVATSEGGGVYMTSSGAAVTMNGGTVCYNASPNGHGGGIANRNGSLSVHGGSIDHNTAKTGKYGGGIYSSGPLVLDGETTVSCNTAGYGGGVAVFTGANAHTVSGDVTFANNQAYSSGGGLIVDNGTVTLGAGLVFSDNTAQWGGALYHNEGSTTVNGGVFEKNYASNGGGGAIYSNQGALTITDCTIAGDNACNYASQNNHGAGVFMRANADGNTLTVSGGQFDADILFWITKTGSSITGGRFSAPVRYASSLVATPLAGGVFTESAKAASSASLIPSGKTFVANHDAETKAAYPWTIGEKGTLTYVIAEPFPEGATVDPGSMEYWDRGTAWTLAKPTGYAADGGWTFNGWLFPDGSVANEIAAGISGTLAVTSTWTTARQISVKTNGAETASLPIKVTEEWIEKNVEETKRSDEKAIQDKLNETDENGYMKWENYVLGLDPTNNVAGAAEQNESEKTVKVVPNVEKTQADTGFSIAYSLDEVKTNGEVVVAGEATTSDNLNIDLDSVESNAYFKVNVIITKDDDAEKTTKIAATNTLGVLKVAKAPKTALVAVPWNEVGGEDVTVSNLVKTANLSEDDELYVYGTNGEYTTWHLNADKNWVTSGEEEESAAAVTVPRGSAVWLTRSDSTKPIVLFGQVADPAAQAESTLEKKKDNGKPSWNIVAAPSVEALDLNEKFTAESKETIATDTVIVPTDGAPKTYTFKDNAWGYVEAVAFTNNLGKVRTRSVRVTDDTKVPAGTGFMYLNSDSVDSKVKW